MHKPSFKSIYAETTDRDIDGRLLYKAEKPSVCPSVRPSASQDNLSGFSMDRLGTWFVHIAESFDT